MLIFAANSVVSEDIDGSCSLAGEVFEASFELIKTRGSEFRYFAIICVFIYYFSEDAKMAYLLQCLQNPAAERPIQSNDLDPFVM